MENEEYIFETPKKPELTDIKDIKPNCEDFSNSEKAEALITNLKLSIGDTIREDSEEEYTINPKMVLEGETPEQYKMTIENLKKILTLKEIKSLNDYINRKNENSHIKDLIYNRITKRTNKFYYRGEIKKSLSEDIKDILLFFKNNNHTGLNNTIYHLLKKEKSDYVYCYKCAWNNKPIPNIQKWNEKDDGQYRVLTDSESDSACGDYLDDDYLWKQAVESGNTTSSLEDWKQEVISSDGRGSLLNGYDGVEESEEINETWFYIYRTN